MPVLRVLPKPLTCAHCGEPFAEDEDVRWLNEEEARHTWDCPQWKPSGPISDGTLRCPQRHGDLPCQKHIPAGWHENEGHSGGHWFAPDERTEAFAAGELHVDARAMLALEPFDEHRAADCPDPATCPGAL